MRALILAAAALLLPTSAAAGDARLTSGDLQEIRTVIHRQIDAYRACAKTAAPPRVSSAAPAAVSFREVMVVDIDAVVQQVQVTDRSGALWLAYYAMQRQRDGSWRTNGCHLVQPARTISAAYQPQ